LEVDTKTLLFNIGILAFMFVSPVFADFVCLRTSY